MPVSPPSPIAACIVRDPAPFAGISFLSSCPRQLSLLRSSSVRVCRPPACTFHRTRWLLAKRRPIVADIWGLGWVSPQHTPSTAFFLAVSCLATSSVKKTSHSRSDMNGCYWVCHGAPQGPLAHTKREKRSSWDTPAYIYIAIYIIIIITGCRWR